MQHYVAAMQQYRTAQIQISDEQSPPGYLISWASAGPPGSAPKSMPKFLFSVSPPFSVSTSTCTIVAPFLFQGQFKTSLHISVVLGNVFIISRSRYKYGRVPVASLMYYPVNLLLFFVVTHSAGLRPHGPWLTGETGCPGPTWKYRPIWKCKGRKNCKRSFF